MLRIKLKKAAAILMLLSFIFAAVSPALADNVGIAEGGSSFWYVGDTRTFAGYNWTLYKKDGNSGYLITSDVIDKAKSDGTGSVGYVYFKANATSYPVSNIYADSDIRKLISGYQGCSTVQNTTSYEYRMRHNYTGPDMTWDEANGTAAGKNYIEQHEIRGGEYTTYWIGSGEQRYDYGPDYRTMMIIKPDGSYTYKDYLYILSKAEAKDVPADIRACGNYWFTRTGVTKSSLAPGEEITYPTYEPKHGVYLVYDNGTVGDIEYYSDCNSVSARPAVQINLQSPIFFNVLFKTDTSAGKGKNLVDVGDGFALPEVANTSVLTKQTKQALTFSGTPIVNKTAENIKETVGTRISSGVIDLTTPLKTSTQLKVTYSNFGTNEGQDHVAAVVSTGSGTGETYVNYAKLSIDTSETDLVVDTSNLTIGTPYNLYLFAEKIDGTLVDTAKAYNATTNPYADAATELKSAGNFTLATPTFTNYDTLAASSYATEELTASLGGGFNLSFDNAEYKTGVTVGDGQTGTITAHADGTTLTGDVTVGSGGTLTTANSFAFGGEISGTGTIINNGTVTAQSGSVINAEITNTGATTLETGASFGTNGKISGGNVTLGKDVAFDNTNFDGITALISSGEGAKYNFNASVTDGNPTVAQITVTNTATGNLKLGSANVTGTNTLAQWDIGDTKTAQYLKNASGDVPAGSTLTITNTTTAANNGYAYKFGQAKEADGTTDKIGWVSIKKDNGYTLARIVQNYEDTTQTPSYFAGNVATYALLTDYTETAELGTLVNTTSGSRTLTIHGNNHKFAGGGFEGIATKAGDTLDIVNVKEISGWKDGKAFTNAGALNFSASGTDAPVLELKDGISNSGTVTFGQNVTLTGSLTGDGSYVNNGTLDVANAANLAMENELTNTGTVNLGGTTASTLGAKITGGNLNVNGDVTSNADNIAGTANTVASGGTLTLNSGTLGKAITNSGTVTLTGITALNAAVNNGTLVFAQDITTNADYAAADENTINSGKTLTLNSGTLDKAVSGVGNAAIAGDVSANASNFANGGTLSVTGSVGNLTLTEGSLAKDIANSGNVKFDAGGGNTITAAGKFTGTGTLEVASGTLNYTGNSIANAVKIDANATLDPDANVFAADVENDGTLILTGNIADITAPVATDTGYLNANITGSGTLQIGDGANPAHVYLGSGKSITAGTLDVKANAAYTGTLERMTISNNITNAGTFNVTGGTLNQAIANSGSVTLETGASFGTNGKISGGNVTLGKDVAFDNTNFDGITALISSGEGAKYNFNASVTDGNPTVAQITVTDTATGNLQLGSANVTGENTLAQWDIGDTKTAQYLKNASGDVPAGSMLTIGGTATATNDGWMYKFGQAKEADGTTNKIGWVSIKKDNGYTLARIVQNYEDTTQTPSYFAGNVATYALLSDYTETSDLGELVNVTGETSRTLTIQGNNHNFAGGNSVGIATKTDDTLNVVNVKEISGWADDTAFTNAGTLNFSGTNALELKDGITNTGSVTFDQNVTLEGKLEGDGSYVNNGTLDVANAANLAMENELTNTGTVNLGGTTASTLGAKITGGNLNVNGDVTSNADNIAGTANTVASGGTLKLTAGTLEHAVSGAGTLEFAANLTANAGSVAADTNIVDSGVTLVLNSGTLGKEISGDGTTEIAGEVAAEAMVSTANYKVAETGKLTTDVRYIGSSVTNNGIVNLTGGLADETISPNKLFAKLGADITGEGKTIIDGYIYAADKKLATETTVNSGKELYISADGLKKTIANEGLLYLADGTLTQNVTGGGVTAIRGDVETAAEINQSSIAVETGSLTTNADFIKTNIINSDTVNFTGGTLADIYVSLGGTTNIKGKMKFNKTVGLLKNLTSDSTINFYLDGFKAGDTIVISNKPVALGSTEIGLYQVTDTENKLTKKGNKITLISSVEGYEYTEDEPNLVNVQGGMIEDTYGVYQSTAGALEAAFFRRGPADETKSFSEARLAGMAAINSGSDLIAAAITDDDKPDKEFEKTKDWKAFAAIEGVRSRYETGSRIDLNGTNVAAGLSKKVNDNITLGIFAEGGNGRYTTENEFEDGNVRADGDVNYFGGGIFVKAEGKKTAKGQLHGEASFRAGHINSDYNSETFELGTHTRFDTSNAYLGAHAAVGYKWALKEGSNVDTYVKYLWNRQNGSSMTIDGNEFDLDAVNSRRLRAGFRYNGKENENGIKFFGGLACEYEFDGKAKGHMGEYALLEPDFKGGSGMAELGVKYDKKDSPWKAELGVTGYTGRRDSIAARLNAWYEFDSIANLRKKAWRTEKKSIHKTIADLMEQIANLQKELDEDDVPVETGRPVSKIKPPLKIEEPVIEITNEPEKAEKKETKKSVASSKAIKEISKQAKSSVQIGASQDKGACERLAAKAKKAGFDAKVITARKGSAAIYRVRIFSAGQTLQALMKQLQAKGFNGIVAKD